jgi:hypothetical protein
MKMKNGKVHEKYEVFEEEEDGKWNDLKSNRFLFYCIATHE